MTYRVYREFDKRYYEEYDSMKEFALERANHQCESCGSSNNLHVHHVIPKSEGGDNSPNNIEVLCPSCHGQEHNKLSCLYCGNLVPVNHQNGLAYWMEPATHEPICYNCKDDPYRVVESNLPPDVYMY